MRKTATSLALLLALALAPTLRAQPRPGGSFGEVIDVRVVNLEVVVTEKGERVTGLGPDDFVLTVDGREVPIEYFTEVLYGTAVAPAEEAEGTVPALAPGEPVGTSFLVFVDEYFTVPADRDRILRRITEQLPSLGPHDRMAVVAYDGRDVEMLSSWSRSTRDLTSVFRKAEDRPAYGLRWRSEQRIFESSRETREEALSRAGSSVVQRDLDVEERQQAALVRDRVERVVLAATSALRSFANPPGRKVMLLFSGGWPYNPAYWVVNDPERSIFIGADLDGGEKLYRPLVETANRLSYTLYTVDVPGLDASAVDARTATLVQANRRANRVRDREWDEEVTLGALADQTGGRALIDSAGADALERVVADTRSYYWLGFTPDWQGDDSEHEVEVRTRDKKYKVRSRESFSDLSRESEVSMMVESALRFGDPPTAAPLGVLVGEPEKAGRRKVVMPFRIVIPLDALTFLQQGDEWVAETELRVAVLDEDGNTADIPVIPLGLSVEEEPEPGRFTLYDTKVKIRKQKHDLVVSLYDVASGQILSAKVELDPTR